MAKNLVYKKSTSTTLKAVGFLNEDKSALNVDGEEIRLQEMAADFPNDTLVEVQIKFKDDEDLSLETDLDE